MFDNRRWYDRYDKSYEQAKEDGHFDNLPGEGKPLNLDMDPNVPNEQRVAFGILKENDMAPEWIMMGRTLENDRKKLVSAIKAALKRNAGMEADAERVASHLRAAYRQNAKDLWAAEQRKLEKRVEKYNSSVISYNIKAPPGVAKRPYFDLHAEINRLRGV